MALTTITFRPPVTNAQREAEFFKEMRSNLNADAGKEIKAAGQDVKNAGSDFVKSVANTLGAGVNVLRFGEKTAEGAVLNAKAGVDLASSALLVTLAGGVEVLQGGREAAALGLKGASRGFAKMAQLLANVRGDGNHITAKTIQGNPNAKSAAAVLMSMAGDELRQSGIDSKHAMTAFGNAVADALGAGANVVNVGWYLAETTGELIKAGAEAGVAGLAETGKLATDIAELSVLAADQGLAGAENLMVGSAKVTAGLANAIKTPGQTGVQIEVKTAAQEYKQQLQTILAANSHNTSPKFLDFKAKADAYIAFA